MEDVAGTVKELIQQGKVRAFGMSEAGVATSAGPMRYSRSRRCRASTRCGGGSRKQRSFRRWRSSASPLSPSPRSGRLPDRHDRREHAVRGDRLPEHGASVHGRGARCESGARRSRSGDGGTKGATPAQIALAWLLAQKPWIVPIPGTTKLHRVEENVAAAEVELTRQELDEIDLQASRITLEGERYSEANQRVIDR